MCVVATVKVPRIAGIHILLHRAQGIDVGDDALCDIEHELAGFGQSDDPVAGALKDFKTEFGLEQQDLAADAGLRGVKRIGSS